MKQNEKLAARQLRAQGLSLGEIRKKLGVAKSSVSLWVRDIVLDKKILQAMSDKGFRREVIERRRSTRLERAAAGRQKVVERAEKEITKISKRELWLIGVMLYCAEGGKTQRSLVRFSNGDPRMIQIMMAFFRRVCDVPEEKFRGYIHIHPHLNVSRAEEYWSTIMHIPKRHFFKTYQKVSSASKQLRDTLPYGTLDIYVCNTELFLKIQGWAAGIFAAVD